MEQGGTAWRLVASCARAPLLLAQTDPEKARAVKRASPQVPVFIGSGITSQTIGDFADCADGFIVGTALKKDGIATNLVDLGRVKALMGALV